MGPRQPKLSRYISSESGVNINRFVRWQKLFKQYYEQECLCQIRGKSVHNCNPKSADYIYADTHLKTHSNLFWGPRSVLLFIVPGTYFTVTVIWLAHFSYGNSLFTSNFVMTSFHHTTFSSADFKLLTSLTFISKSIITKIAVACIKSVLRHFSIRESG